eukprot:jgi/Chrzof1/6683/Cz19g05180.t1
MADAAAALPEAGQEQAGPSNPSRRRVTIARHEIPLDLLVAKHDPRKLPKHVVASEENIRRVNKDFAWSSKREHLLAAAAAGVHLALFAYNLAFWGFEGMPPDRYWPANPRHRLQVKPRRYGNLEGTKKLWYYYLSKIEGVK